MPTLRILWKCSGILVYMYTVLGNKPLYRPREAPYVPAVCFQHSPSKLRLGLTTLGCSDLGVYPQSLLTMGIKTR